MLNSVLSALVIAAGVASAATCPDWVGRLDAYAVGTVVSFNGANYKVIRDLGNGWIEPTNTWFWEPTTATCDAVPTIPAVDVGAALTQILANQALILQKLNALSSDHQAILAKLDGVFTDGRDGQSYRTVKIGSQVWMARNLNFATSTGSTCPDGNEASCSINGRTYTWSAATTACPEGWHLPTKVEWTALVQTVGAGAATKLKAVTGWTSTFVPNAPAGTDTYGFTAIPTATDIMGSAAYWWDATLVAGSNPQTAEMTHISAGMDLVDLNAGAATSAQFWVRCLQN